MPNLRATALVVAGAAASLVALAAPAAAGPGVNRPPTARSTTSPS
jgi:hypothetical protein